MSLLNHLYNFFKNSFGKICINIKGLYGHLNSINTSAFCMALSMLITPHASMFNSNNSNFVENSEDIDQQQGYYETIAKAEKSSPDIPLSNNYEEYYVFYDGNGNSLPLKNLKDDIIAMTAFGVGDVLPGNQLIFDKFNKPNIDEDNEVVEEPVENDSNDNSIESKIEWVLEEYDLTLEQLYDIVCTVYVEGGYGKTECSAVTSTLLNRYNSNRFNRYVSKSLNDEELGKKLYGQLIAPNQYAYGSKRFFQYKEMGYEALSEYEGFEAIVDTLCSGATNDYMSFRSYPYGENPEQFTSNGNYFFNVLTDDDRIIREEEQIEEPEEDIKQQIVKKKLVKRYETTNSFDRKNLACK